MQLRKPTTKLILLSLGIFALPLSGNIIGIDDFEGTPGDITTPPNDSNGTGWEWNNDTQDQTNNAIGAALWTTPFGTASVITDLGGNSVVVSNGGAHERKYGEDEGNGAVKAAGRFFYKVKMTRSSTAEWGWIMHSDFGTEKVKFGAAGTDDIPTIEISNADPENGTFTGSLPAFVDDQAYTIVTVVDFDNDLVGMWVDPDVTDYWTAGASNSADITAPFTNSNWASRVRIGSGGSVSWDDLTVATDPGDVGLQDFVDADGDGMPLDFELANGLDDSDDGTIGETSLGAKDGPNGALGNPDADGLTNIAEFDGTGVTGFSGGTDPQDADSDDDSLNDGPELTMHSTDPLDPDSDNDELTDGAEVNTHSTDPNLADTDGGGTPDGIEIAVGTLPQTGNAGDDPTSNGSITFIGLEGFDYPDGNASGLAGGDGFDFDNLDSPDAFTGHTGSASDWTSQFGDSNIFCQKLQTRESGIIRQFNGLSEGASGSEATGAILASPGVTNQTTDVIWMKFDISRSAGAVWSGVSLFSYGEEKVFIGVPGIQAATDELGYEEPGGVNNTGSGKFLVDGDTNTVVMKVNIPLGELDVYLNPDLSGAEPDPINDTDIFGAFNPFDLTAIRCASGGSDVTEWDNILVVTTWADLQTAPADANSNGLRDSFEAGFGVSDPIANGDSDTLNNLAEQTAGTNPILSDTDGDGANDDVEVNSSGTDPCDADSDGDGIEDGPEIDGTGNTFDGAPTNPLLADSDSDTFDDLVEVNFGFDPNDGASNPTAAGIILIDGAKDSLYPAASAVQTINSAFNFNQLDAVYASVVNGRLNLMVTGNLENNFNKLDFFFDTNDTITTNVMTAAGNDSTANLNGMTFDIGFAPDYQITVRQGFRFDADIADIGTAAFDSYVDVFGGSGTGFGTTATGTVNGDSLSFALNNSNTAGILEEGGGTAADQTAALAVTTGVELSVALADIGASSGSMKIMVLLNNGGHDFMSNQSLPGMPVGTENLGASSVVDFSALAGDQFFILGLPDGLDIDLVSYNGSNFVVNVTGTESGKNYHITSSTTLTGFTPTGVTFDNSTATSISIPANSGTNTKQFFRAEEFVAP
ncbi:MAG: hypothetical protein ACSHYB_02450 [Roseibacillus sp.]